MLSMKQRVFRIIAAILAIVMLIGAIPVSAFLISKFTKDKNNSDEPVSLSVSNNNELIQKANSLANGVNVRYSDSTRTDLIISNQDVNLQYTLMGDDERQVDSITTLDGKEYISDTMDMYVRTKDGDTYYSSKTNETVLMNTFRFGYYYYDVRLEGHDFVNLETIINDEDTVYDKIVMDYRACHDMIAEETRDEDNNLVNIKYTTMNSSDPYVYNNSINMDVLKYQYIKLTMTASLKAGVGTMGCQMFVIAGDRDKFSEGQKYSFKIYPDGQEHEYYLPLYSIDDYNGLLKGVRFDFGASVGDVFTISKIEAVGNSGAQDVASIKMSRNFNTYSNKINHVAQLLATKYTPNIQAIGMETKVPVNKVNKIIVKDMFDYHSTLDNVVEGTIEFVGFDIRDVGVIGYIMLKDETSGILKVDLKDGFYVITQERAPKDNCLHAVDDMYKDKKLYNNCNDFYIGQRIYTDKTHSWQGLKEEAYEEYNPLPAKHIKVNADKSTNAKYVGYDALRGCYAFELLALGFGDSYLNYPNKHCNVSFSIIGDTYNRDIYVLSESYDANGNPTGSLESAALLDSSNMMLPIPMEVCKNFGGDGDHNIYQYNEISYGETIFPMVIKAQETNSVNLINMYQNWGNYPLKQISSIEYFQPYYHLSTGVTETNCITNYSASRLPDHRAMSGSWWKNQPQHASAGTHKFLRYTDSDGIYSGEEWCGDMINSYGPTYSDISMSYLSYDAKIKVTYNHIEMPQTDENRGYYTMTYEFLDDITINKFRDNFSFYSVVSNDPTGLYAKIGYLNGNNTHITTERSTTTKTYIPLGDKVPYFSFYNMSGYTTNQSGDAPVYSNVSFIIQDYKLNTTNIAQDTRFVVINYANSLTLSLNIKDTASFKAGDSITINAILMPWGSEKYDYTKLDAPVREVRKSLLEANRLKITALNNCDEIEHPFIPQVKSTNGLNAEFSLKGGASINPDIYPDGVDASGNPLNKYDKTVINNVTIKRERCNNVAVRVYGFGKLKRPVVYEKIGGEWKLYELSSKNNPDKRGYAYDYDGYGVHYDSDGTYSYSFIVPMKDGAEREFKIIVADTYTLSANASGGVINDVDGWTIAENKNAATKLVYQGDKIGSLPEAQRPGYTFAGWYKGTVLSGKTVKVQSTSFDFPPSQLQPNTTYIINYSVTLNSQFANIENIDETSQKLGATLIAYGSTIDYISGIDELKNDLLQIKEGNLTWEDVIGKTYDYVGEYTTPNNLYKFSKIMFYPPQNPSGGVAETRIGDITIQKKEDTPINSMIDMPQNGLTIVAKWTPNQYQATFDANGGTMPASTLPEFNVSADRTKATKAIMVDAAYDNLPIPTREGFEFAGWGTGNNLLDVSGRMQGILTKSTTANPQRFQYNRYYVGMSYNNYYSPNAIVDYSIFDNEITQTNNNTGYGIALPIRVKPNTKYTISGVVEKISANAANGYIANAQYTANGEYINGGTQSVVTTANNCYTLVIICWSSKGDTVKFKNLQVEEGDEKTSYLPHCYSNQVTSTTTNKTPYNHTLVARWKYKVEYNGNGATDGAMEASWFELGKRSKLNTNQYKKEGYKFVGWTSNANIFDHSKVTSQNGSLDFLETSNSSNNFTFKVTKVGDVGSAYGYSYALDVDKSMVGETFKIQSSTTSNGQTAACILCDVYNGDEMIDRVAYHYNGTASFVMPANTTKLVVRIVMVFKEESKVGDTATVSNVKLIRETINNNSTIEDLGLNANGPVILYAKWEKIN